MYVEALNTYNIMTKNKMFPHVNQLKLNMGNIYFKMGHYPKAIKMYRMALDSVPHVQKLLRIKITHNIGILFVRMGQYADAAASFEFVMTERADVKNGMHLILCYYAIGDVEKIKATFRAILEVNIPEYENDVEDLNIHQHNDHQEDGAMGGERYKDDEYDVKDPDWRHEIIESFKTDELAIYCQRKKDFEKKCITMVVDLISPVIEENYNEGLPYK